MHELVVQVSLFFLWIGAVAGCFVGISVPLLVLWGGWSDKKRRKQ